MKIGVLSDTHLQQVTKEFFDIYNTYLSDVDMIIHAGDVVSPDIVDFLEKNVFHGVQGNMDPLEVKALLPEKIIVEVAQYRLGIIHGWGAASGLEERILPLFPNVDVIIYGHSHIPVNHVREGVLLFNPGTATGYSKNGLNSIGILEVSETVEGQIIPV
ncbi:MAG: metallophosphoesterase [Deltaproteobacteria bacterium]|nr:metallophosphoesterase [Deltaproteobacteria bacterium]